MYKTPLSNDQEWIIEHFEELVERYAGQCIAVVNQRVVAVADSEAVVEEESRKRYPRRRPSVLRVPRPEDFTCVLSFLTRSSVVCQFRSFR